MLIHTTYAPLDLSTVTALCFFAAAVLLDFFDISLPRGDSVGVGGALSAAALIVLGPAAGLAVSIAAAVVAHFARRRGESLPRLLTIIFSRVAATFVSAGALVAFPPGLRPEIVYVVVTAVFLIGETAFAQAAVSVLTSRPYVRLMRGNLRSQAPLLLAEWASSVLLLLTYGGQSALVSDAMSQQGLGRWSLVPVTALLLLMRQSYAMFLDIRETYRTTVEVVVEAAESQDPRRMGHADRSAEAARSIAMRLGLSASAVERISYAALLHDIAELSEAPNAGMHDARRVTSADILDGVEFFNGVEPILRVCSGAPSPEGSDDDLLAAFVVSLASEIDAAASPQINAAHHLSILDSVAPHVSPTTKARVVGAAIELGYKIPAVG